MNVLYEDNHLLAVSKPSGIATMGDPGESTVHRWGCEYLRHKYQKPGRVFLGIVSRLDKPTTGALVLARTSKAASRLTEQFAAKSQSQRSSKYPPAEKVYLAVVEGTLEGDQVWRDDCINDESAERMRVVPAGTPGAKTAQCRVRTLAVGGRQSLVAVHLQTGRKHQIRFQSAHRGHPVIGEFKYARRTSANEAFGLHSWILQVRHPTLGEDVCLVAPPPRNWQTWFPEVLPRQRDLNQWADQIRRDFGLRGTDDG